MRLSESCKHCKLKSWGGESGKWDVTLEDTSLSLWMLTGALECTAVDEVKKNACTFVKIHRGQRAGGGR